MVISAGKVWYLGKKKSDYTQILSKIAPFGWGASHPQ
jgi:hypothetical protein